MHLVKILIISLIFINCILFTFYITQVYIPPIHTNNNVYIDKYTNVPLLVYNVEENPKSIDIIINYLDNNETIKSRINDIKNVNIVNVKSNNSALELTDTFTYLYKYPKYKVLTVINDNKYCLFMKPKDHVTNESMKDVINNKKVIGYIDDLDTKLIKYICLAQGIDPNLIKLKKVPIPKVINDKYFIDNEIYTLMLFTSFSNNLILDSIHNDFKIDFLNYEDFDINIIKFLIPFVKIINIDLSVPFINFKNDYAVKTCFAFDFLLCGDGKLENDVNLGLKFNKLIVRFGNFDVINFYTMYFSFFKQTIEYLNVSNNHIKNQDNLPILEQFSIDSSQSSQPKVVFDISPEYNIDGFYDNKNQSMLLDFTMINDIPLTLHSRITLTQQERFEENGTYFVKFQTDDGMIEQTFIQKFIIYNDPIDNTKYKDGIINISNIEMIEGIYLNDIKNDDNIYIVNIDKFANIIKGKKEKEFYLKIKGEIVENSTYDPRYECYDDPLIKSRGLCESKYDPNGKPKFKKQYWDRRCEKNEECPFYMENKNYKNYRGGCIDGRCEFPIGMKAVSYRKYDPEFKPMCYNCKDISDPFCCDDQKNKKKYNYLESPDYAFSLDSHERMKEIKEIKNNHIKWFNK